MAENKDPKKNLNEAAEALGVNPEELCEELGVDDLESVAGGICCLSDSCCDSDGGDEPVSRVE